MKDRSDDPSRHERTLLPRSYISLRFENVALRNRLTGQNECIQAASNDVCHRLVAFVKRRLCLSSGCINLVIGVENDLHFSSIFQDILHTLTF